MNTAAPWVTEGRNPATMSIDEMSASDMVSVILEQDAQVVAAVQQTAPQIAQAAEAMATSIHGGGHVYYVGAGTSGRLGVLDAVELWPTYRVGDDVLTASLAGGFTALTDAVEGAEDDAEAGSEVVKNAGAGDLVVGIAASGRTPYVIGALQTAKDAGATTVLIAANPATQYADLADIPILFNTGPEVITGSTRMKSATAQKIVLNTMSTAAMVRLGKTYSNLMIDMIPTNIKLRQRAVRMLAQGSGADEETAAQRLAQADGNVRVALVALLADTDTASAAAALAKFPPDPQRAGDPSGIRSSVAAVTSSS